jgi:hypothetical protein
MKPILHVATVLGLMLSLTAFGIALITQQQMNERVKLEVDRQLMIREQSLVARVRPTIVRMRANVGQPPKDIQTINDAAEAIMSVFDLVGDAKPK